MFRRVKLDSGPDAGKWQIADRDGKALAGYGTFDTEEEAKDKQDMLNGVKPWPKQKVESLSAVINGLISGGDEDLLKAKLAISEYITDVTKNIISR